MTPTHPRATHLIELLGLERHPEGGYFAEVHRSPRRVRPRDDRGERCAVTTIYFLLVSGTHSRWHRVASDEVWHFYEGDPLELLMARADAAGADSRPVHVVPAGAWQAARTTGAFSLVGCTVAPGFEFVDFEMLADEPELSARFRERFPELGGLI